MQKFLTSIALGLVWVLSLLPTPVSRFIGSVLGTLGFYLVKNRRNVGIRNLTLCFPEMSQEEKNAIIKQHFKYLITSALQYGLVFYASPDRIKKLVKLKDLDFVLEYYGKRPVVLLCSHFVGLDLGAIRLTLEIVGFSIYSKQKNSLITEKLKDARLRFIKDKGGKVFARQEGLRPVLKELKQTNHVFYYLPDQDFGERDSLFVPFFSQPTCATVNVLPKIVQLTNAVVIPTAVFWENDHYEMVFYKAWDNYPTGNLENDVIRMNKFIENVVKYKLPQYFWLHKRFKTQPGLERGFLYKDC